MTTIDQKCGTCGALKSTTELGAWRSTLDVEPHWQHDCPGTQGSWQPAVPTVVGANVYIASSWKNPYYEHLRDACVWAGYAVYDWKNSDAAFHWKTDLGMMQFERNEVFLRGDTEIVKVAESGVKFSNVAKAMQDERVKRAFRNDTDEAARAQVIVLLLPAGRNAHFEFGIAKGIRMGPPVVRPALIVACLEDRVIEPETIYAGADAMVIGVGETMRAIARHCP